LAGSSGFVNAPMQTKSGTPAAVGALLGHRAPFADRSWTLGSLRWFSSPVSWWSWFERLTRPPPSTARPHLRAEVRPKVEGARFATVLKSLLSRRGRWLRRSSMEGHVSRLTADHDRGYPARRAHFTGKIANSKKRPISFSRPKRVQWIGRPAPFARHLGSRGRCGAALV